MSHYIVACFNLFLSFFQLKIILIQIAHCKSLDVIDLDQYSWFQHRTNTSCRILLQRRSLLCSRLSRYHVVHLWWWSQITRAREFVHRTQRLFTPWTWCPVSSKLVKSYLKYLKRYEKVTLVKYSSRISRHMSLQITIWCRLMEAVSFTRLLPPKVLERNSNANRILQLEHGNWISAM